ncbi:hypothetical protein SBA4_220042 [Candidatus Sulfopaludibacter sp. SbA4]|nr:hypothetical protein SBA4_220042 [Candidatus Sulfopaludibacter sp. SbA4]
MQNPIAGGYDATHLKAIHKHVFQNVFTWAGEFRTTALGKAEYFGQPPSWFTPPGLLEREADRIFEWLHRADLLRGLPRVEFARQAAQLLAAVNKLHPFREGNGRTQRLFVDAVAGQAGHELWFDVVSQERMVRASIEANNGHLGMMTRMFEEIIEADRIQPLRRAIAFLSRERFNWNETYIATTTVGQSYEGRLVGRDGEAFMMRSDDDRILHWVRGRHRSGGAQRTACRVSCRDIPKMKPSPPTLWYNSPHLCELDLPHSRGVDRGLCRIRRPSRLGGVRVSISSRDRRHRDADRAALRRKRAAAHRRPDPGDLSQDLRQPLPGPA